MLMQMTDDELMAECFLSMDPRVQELCKRVEQANEKLEMLQTLAGCGSFDELKAFVHRHADDGK